METRNNEHIDAIVVVWDNGSTTRIESNGKATLTAIYKILCDQWERESRR